MLLAGLYAALIDRSHALRALIVAAAIGGGIATPLHASQLTLSETSRSRSARGASYVSQVAARGV